MKGLKLILFITFLFSSLHGFSQEQTEIDILNANYGVFEKVQGESINKLIGDVIFRHEGVLMYCDSAYYYPSQNIVYAFSRIHIKQGDTLHLYGDFLKYKGNIKLAEVRNNVRLIDKETNLKTEYLDFNIEDNIGYYIGGGEVINGENNLQSLQGYYYSEDKLFFFKDSVVIRNPDYTIYSDTLKYNTVSEIAYFLGPTRIISEENFIYCENGWYDTKQNISQFAQNAYLKNENQILRGDSLYYERDNGIGKAFMNVELIDSIENVILCGNYAVYQEDMKSFMITQHALFIQISGEDSLFIHADTLRSQYDTSGTYKIYKAYYKVKLFKSDLQAKCDSLAYSLKDSIIQLFTEPVIWSDEHQLTSEYIEIYTVNNKIEHVELQNTAFIISQEDSVRFNQIKGKNMIGYFKNDELYKVDVNGNGQTIYYPKDNNEIIGVNKAESTDLIIYIKNKEIDRILFITKPVSTLYPLDQISEKELKLKDFKWLDNYRPKTKNDVFTWIR